MKRTRTSTHGGHLDDISPSPTVATVVAVAASINSTHSGSQSNNSSRFDGVPDGILTMIFAYLPIILQWTRPCMINSSNHLQVCQRWHRIALLLTPVHIILDEAATKTPVNMVDSRQWITCVMNHWHRINAFECRIPHVLIEWLLSDVIRLKTIQTLRLPHVDDASYHFAQFIESRFLSLRHVSIGPPGRPSVIIEQMMATRRSRLIAADESTSSSASSSSTMASVEMSINGRRMDQCHECHQYRVIRTLCDATICLCETMTKIQRCWDCDAKHKLKCIGCDRMIHPSSDTVPLNNMSKDSKINRTTTNIPACGVPIKCDACSTQQYVCGAHLLPSTMPPDVWMSKCYPLLTCYECKTERCRQHIVWHCPDFDCCGIAYCIPCWDTKGYTKCVSQVTGFFHCWNCGLKTIG
jgi:hypothetical protein